MSEGWNLQYIPKTRSAYQGIPSRLNIITKSNAFLYKIFPGFCYQTIQIFIMPVFGDLKSPLEATLLDR